VEDVIEAVLTALRLETSPYQVYNVATGDYITVTEIAELAVECVGLAPGSVRFAYRGGDRGWKGDIPVVRLNTDRIRALGWANRMPTGEALRSSILAMIPDAKEGRL
jgi:UDP-glucose 4-epimerase